MIAYQPKLCTCAKSACTDSVYVLVTGNIQNSLVRVVTVRMFPTVIELSSIIHVHVIILYTHSARVSNIVNMHKIGQHIIANTPVQKKVELWFPLPLLLPLPLPLPLPLTPSLALSLTLLLALSLTLSLALAIILYASWLTLNNIYIQYV
jgi:hypothetical protein